MTGQLKIYKLISYTLATIVFALLTMTALGSGEKGFDYYAKHEFDKAIDACKDNKDNFSRMVAALAYAERFGLYKNSEDKVQKNAYLNILQEIVTLKDLAEIERLLSVTGNPFGFKEAEKLLKKAFANVKTTDDVLIAADFLSSERDPDHNHKALVSIANFLKQVRNYVNKGGTMPSNERELFTDENLIAPLVDILGLKENSRQALRCLVLIEEPALPYLEAETVTKSISDTIVAVRKAMAKRQKKFLNSTWYSAAGG